MRSQLPGDDIDVGAARPRDADFFQDFAIKLVICPGIDDTENETYQANHQNVQKPRNFQDLVLPAIEPNLTAR